MPATNGIKRTRILLSTNLHHLSRIVVTFIMMDMIMASVLKDHKDDGDEVMIFWASISKPDGRLAVRSHEVSKPWDSGLDFSNRSEIWQQRWRNDHYKIQSCGFETCSKTSIRLVNRGPSDNQPGNGWRAISSLCVACAQHSDKMLIRSALCIIYKVRCRYNAVNYPKSSQ